MGVALPLLTTTGLTHKCGHLSSVYSHTHLPRGHSLDLRVYTPTVGFTPQSQDPGKRPMQLCEPVLGLELQVWGREDML